MNASKSKIFPDSKNEYIEITPQQTVLVSKTSDLVYGIILKVTLDSATYLIQVNVNKLHNHNFFIIK